MRIFSLNRTDLGLIPEGEPIPSVLPQKGYGDHSCSQCMASTFCTATWRQGLDQGVPNGCSLYWPPNTCAITRETWQQQLDAMLNARQTTLEDIGLGHLRKKRVVRTPTGKTLFITKRLWIHWFYKHQRLWYDWGIGNRALHTPWFMVAYRSNILGLKK